MNVLLALIVCVLSTGLRADDEQEKSKSSRKPVDVRFSDGSTLKLDLQVEQYELGTQYGKLVVPAGDIRLIEIGTRVAPEITKQVEEAIANLGSAQYEIREKAAKDLLAIGAKGYAAMLRASKTKDAEIESRLEDILDKVRASLPESLSEIREYDVVHTRDSRISGKLSVDVIQARSPQFGTVEMKLADVRDLKFEPAEEEIDLSKVEAAPHNLYDRVGNIGKVYVFKVTGAISGSIWGTDTYTGDSSLATAAVHAGAVKNGQTGIVRVKIVDPPGAFLGSSRNGITSYDYGVYPGAYKIIKR